MASADQGSDSSRLPPELSARVPVRETLPLDSLEQGDRFPPVVVFRGDGRDLLSDGFHRVHAYRKAGRSEIEADVRPGTFDDALWFALGANSGHGERLQRGDKRHAIELAYRAWPDASQRRIAEHVGCSQAHVGRVRSQLKPMFQLPDRVVGSDGRTRPATRVPSRSSGVAPSTVLERPVPLPATESEASPRAAASPSVATAPRVGHRSAVEESDPSPDPLGDQPASVAQPALPGSGSSPSAVVESSSSPASSAAAAPVSPALRSVTDRSNRILSNVVQAARGLTEEEDLIHFPCVDRDRLPEWIADLEEARRSLTRFITRLREEVSDGTRTSALED